jgi:mono/diheme cytochrome c family protein
MRWASLAVLCLLSLGWPQPAALAADAAVLRGRALYDGAEPLPAREGGKAAACVGCHRVSGLGNFEGGLPVPPITGPTLFQAFDPDTAHYFSASARWRVRPAYDEPTLGALLRQGQTPDGKMLHAAMPRYQIGPDQLASLTAYLRGLSSTPPRGVDEQTVHLATVITPDADTDRSRAMLQALDRFIAQKNGQSRQEAQRRRQAGRTREMAMYRKFRLWELHIWRLQGPPAGWGAQLDALQAQQPVYALVSGMGRSEWAPIDAFCNRAPLPCLLPIVDAGPGDAGFYSLHFHAGIDTDGALAARLLTQKGVGTVELWFEPAASALAQRVGAVLQRQGLRLQAVGADAVVSLLPPMGHVRRLLAEEVRDRHRVWLTGTRAPRPAELEAVVDSASKGWIVTPLRTGQELERQLQRTRLWMRSQKLEHLHADVVASTLYAATAMGEGLAHVDFNFTQAYVLELLEHGLESLVPWSPYPRLAIGPGQRIASKGSWLGQISQGQLSWEWQAPP